MYPLNVHSVLVFDSRLVVQENAVEKGCFDANKALGDVSYDMQVTRWVGGVGLARPSSSWLPALGLLGPKVAENQAWQHSGLLRVWLTFSAPGRCLGL